MTPIRVHLGPMPRMLRAMINDLLTAEPDIVIVGNSFSDQDSFPFASAQRADLLIAQDSASLPGTCTAAVLSGFPAVILALAADGNDGTCVSMIRRGIKLNNDGSSLPVAVRELFGSLASSAPTAREVPARPSSLGENPSDTTQGRY